MGRSPQPARHWQDSGEQPSFARRAPLKPHGASSAPRGVPGPGGLVHPWETHRGMERGT